MKNQKSSLFLLTALFLLLVSCGQKSKNGEAVTETQAENMMTKNLLQYPQIWEAVADEFGSSFAEGDPFINDERLEVDFTITKKEGDYYPYVELKCFPEVNYSAVNRITIRYECAHELVVKLNQSDFSAGGDESYAHYQFTLPAAAGEANSATIELNDFVQPDWATEASRAVALNKENVEAIYFVPALDYDLGESTKLKIYSVTLHK